MPSPINITLVEDNQADVILLEEALKTAGFTYSLKVLTNGESALEYLDQLDGQSSELYPHLIIVDINLPRRDGHEVVRAIRNSPNLNKLLVAVLTTSENPDDRAKVMAQHATLVTKPASPENLCELLETLEIACSDSAINKQRLEFEQAQELVKPELSNILLLEDNYADRLLFREFINDSGTLGEIYEAANLSAALDILRERKMDLILADLGLPDAKGLEVLNQLNSAARGTPIVILTGNDDEELAIEAASQGAQDYLVKGEVTSRIVVRAMRYAITRKRAEDLALQAVASENELLQEILESAPISMARFTPQLSISAYNSAFVQSINRTIKSIVGHSIKDIIRIPDESLWLAVVYDGAPFRVENFQMRDQSDQARNWDITVWPNRSHSTRARGGIFIAVDITERVKLERQREDFIASLAHDIRNPLIGADRLLSFVDDPKLTEERRAEALDALRKSNSNVLTMLENLLEVHKFEAGATALSFETVSLEKLLQEALSTTCLVAFEKGLSLRVRLSSDLPPICADAMAIERLFTNLIHNALKFSEPGATVELEGHVEEGFVVFSVTDHGVGISQEQQKLIFNRFGESRSSKYFAGAGVGLGLYLCKQIVESHGGTISCTSEVDAGATFAIKLPIKRANPSRLGAETLI